MLLFTLSAVAAFAFSAFFAGIVLWSAKNGKLPGAAIKKKEKSRMFKAALFWYACVSALCFASGIFLLVQS